MNLYMIMAGVFFGVAVALGVQCWRLIRYALILQLQTAEQDKAIDGMFQAVNSVTNTLEHLYCSTSEMGVPYTPQARQLIVDVISKARRLETHAFDTEVVVFERAGSRWPFNAQGDIVAGKKP